MSGENGYWVRIFCSRTSTLCFTQANQQVRNVSWNELVSHAFSPDANTLRKEGKRKCPELSNVGERKLVFCVCVCVFFFVQIQ